MLVAKQRRHHAAEDRDRAGAVFGRDHADADPSSSMAKRSGLDDHGLADFDRLQSRRHDVEVKLIAFDLLAVGGDDIRRVPLHARKVRLAKLLAKSRDAIQLVEHLGGEIGPHLFQTACRMGLEGLASKRRDRPYRGSRSRDWVKVKKRRRLAHKASTSMVGRYDGFRFQVSSHARYIVRPEAMTMIRKRKADSGVDEQRKQHPHEKSESVARELQARIADLKNVPREQLPDATFMLFMAAKQQTEQARHAIEQRAKVQFAFNPPPSGDLADYLAEEIVTALRHHEADAPSLLESLSVRSRDSRFTLRGEEAVLMLAAVIREQRLDGILEGFRLAGLLTKPSKNRHAGAAPTDASRK